MSVRTREVALATGDRFAEFVIEARLGGGETGTTYRARRLNSGRVEALKLLPPRYAVDPVLRDRVTDEALHPALAAHRAALEVYEVEEVDGHLYVASRYVEHGDLSRLIAGGGLAPALAVELLGQLASVLDTAHRHGIVHGGVSAANVLVVGRRALLGDFGLDRGRVQEDPREDVRALGRLLCEMLTGHPFPVRNGLPPAFGRVIDDALADDPGARLETAGEVAAAALGAAALTAADASRPLALGAAALAAATPVRPPTQAARVPTPVAAPLPRDTVGRLPRRHDERLRFDATRAPAGARFWGRAAAGLALAAAIVLAAVVIGAGGGGTRHRTVPLSAPATPHRPTPPVRPRPTASRWPAFATADYRVSLPPGWHVAENDVALGGGAFTETRFMNAAGTAEIDVDRTPRDPLTAAQAAALVRGMASRYAGYRELSFHATTLAGRPAWEWRFLAPPGGVITLQGPRIDLFRNVAGDRYATLGVGTGVPAIAALTRRVAASIRAR